MDLQARIENVADQLIADDAETGLQVVAYHRGQRIVDVAAGFVDHTREELVTPETLFFSFSAAKGVTSLLAHLLVKNGLIRYDTPVAEIWPEFAAHGKESATLRHVLTHTVGLPAMPATIGPADLHDWPRVCAAIAAAAPLWRPGQQTGYHSYTFGYLVGGIALRLTGMPMSQLLHEWVATPLGAVGELYFGVPAAELTRLAQVEDAGPPPTEPAGSPGIVAAWEARPRASLGNDRAFVQADVPSVGTFTARGLAAAYAAMLGGDLISHEQLAELSAVAFEGVDRAFGTPARLALGYPLGRIGARAGEPPLAFGWPGGGGSYAFADPTAEFSFAVIKNRLTPDFTTARLLADTVTAGVR